ncbi:Phosphatidylethanolamine-binding protein PEBP [Niveomyces insectorum RCEF 264]|uniref:Phosphatidylethanolamine-binding protein PEBP n=1 Tax=Niveomyces insectorum RCEF 264 TaxID=1081102 RepID=A0A162MQH1_9HYPO|nr:Phosphatidylethanolamine-binding protein PEBP [Niveomyces insectorum RCEF 264]
MTSRLSPAVAGLLQAIEKKDTDKTPPALRLQFPGGATVTQPNLPVAAPDAQTDPAYAVPSSFLPPGGADKDKTRYLCLSLDIDAPFPSFPFLSPILHGVQTDLVLSPATAAAGDGWTPLVSDVTAVVAYSGPRPPPISGPHRYIFLLYEQPAKLDAAGIRKTMQWPETITVSARMRFDAKAFETALGLGQVVAATTFLAKAS